MVKLILMGIQHDYHVHNHKNYSVLVEDEKGFLAHMFPIEEQ